MRLAVQCHPTEAKFATFLDFINKFCYEDDSVSESENIAVAKALLKANPDTSKANEFGETPLHIASTKGNLALVQLIYENGADIDVKNRDGWSALHCAAYFNHLKIVMTMTKTGWEDRARR